MSDEWYYVRDGQRVGPVSADELKCLANAGELAPAGMVSKKGLGKWVPASSVKGLYSAPGIASTSRRIEEKPVFSDGHVTITPNKLIVGQNDFELRDVLYASVHPPRQEDLRINCQGLVCVGLLGLLVGACMAYFGADFRLLLIPSAYSIVIGVIGMFRIGVIGMFRRAAEHRLYLSVPTKWTPEAVLVSTSHEELRRYAEAINQHLQTTPAAWRVLLDAWPRMGARFFRRVFSVAVRDEWWREKNTPRPQGDESHGCTHDVGPM